MMASLALSGPSRHFPVTKTRWTIRLAKTASRPDCRRCHCFRDPTYGQGMSLTLRDVRTLSNQLLSNSDWDAAANTYTLEHRRYFSVIHTSCSWLRQIFLEQGPGADQRRAAAMPLIAEDPTRIPDHIMSGPELPIDDDVRARFFGEPALR